jgi:alpha-glucoside transport system substrate-binding protein
MKKTNWQLIALLAIMAMILGACGPAVTEAPAMTEAPEMTEAPAMTEAPVATEAPFTYDFGEMVGPAGGFLEKALAGEYKGTTVTVDGTQTDPDDRKMADGWKAFEDATGINLKPASPLPWMPARLLILPTSPSPGKY